MSEPVSGKIVSIRLATWLAVVSGCAFWMLFQVSKAAPIQAVNPFAEDPYDAVASIAGEVALLVAVLNLARLLRRGPATGVLLRYGMHGNWLIIVSLVLTIITDAVAILTKPGMLDASLWSALLLGGLGFLTMLTAASIYTSWRAAGAFREAAQVIDEPPPDSLLADAVEDVFWLITWPAAWLIRRIGWPLALLEMPRTVWKQSEHWPLLGALHPRPHPWRFAVSACLAAGIGLAAAHYFFEGIGSSLPTILLLSAIFIGVETIAGMSGYVLFGGLLGLRPPLRAR